MKIYDKEMYKMESKVRNAVIIIVIFVISFLAGVFSRNIEITQKDEQISEQQEEINSLKQEIESLQGNSIE